MTKQEVQNIIKNIGVMRSYDLDAYAQKVYMAKQDIDSRAFGFIQKAIDIRKAELSSSCSSAVVEYSELVDGEFDV